MAIEIDDSLGYERLTVSTTGTALTVPTGAGAALFYIEGGGIVFRDDTAAGSVAPGTGMVLPASAVPYRYTGPLSSFRAVRAGAVDATLHVLYYES
jgi:hypothetical protein